MNRLMAVFFITAKHSYLLPHAYSININRAMAAGSSGYFIISVNISSTATTNHNVRVLGATIPVTFGYTTAPNLTDTLTNGGLKTIAASFAKTANSIPFPPFSGKFSQIRQPSGAALAKTPKTPMNNRKFNLE